jgi:hypothetical protein
MGSFQYLKQEEMPLKSIGNKGILFLTDPSTKQVASPRYQSSDKTW